MDCYLETCYRGPWSREHFLDGDGRAAAQVLEVNLKMIYENSISTNGNFLKIFQLIKVYVTKIDLLKPFGTIRNDF